MNGNAPDRTSNLVTLLREGAEIERLRAALEMLYDKWENGDPCYEDPETFSGGLGNAFKLTADEENAVLALIRRRPENCREPIPHETGKNEADALDAARYRFLRQPGNAIVYAKDRHAWGQNASGHVKYDTPEQLDAAVDAARSQLKASEPQACTCKSESGGEGPGAWASLTTDANCPVHGLRSVIYGNQ